MTANPPETRPRCGSAPEAGFAHKHAGPSFVPPGKLLGQVGFLGEDLTRSGLRKHLPSRAEFHRSALGRPCELSPADRDTTLDRAEAEEVARASDLGGEVG